MDLLLVGSPDEDIRPALLQMGLSQAGAEMIYERQVRQVPFERYRHAKFGDYNKELYAAQNCDLCRCTLNPGDRRVCYHVHWESNYSEDDHSGDRMAFFLGGILGLLLNRMVKSGSTVRKNEMDALYCICPACRKSITAVFGRYDGYPANGEFSPKKVRDIRLAGDTIQVQL